LRKDYQVQVHEKRMIKISGPKKDEVNILGYHTTET